MPRAWLHQPTPCLPTPCRSCILPPPCNDVGPLRRKRLRPPPLYRMSTDTHYTSNSLWIGEHSMTVKAVDSNGARSEQSMTRKIIVNGNVTSNSTSTTASTTSLAPAPPSPDSNAANVESLIDPASYSYPEINRSPVLSLSLAMNLTGVL